MTNQQTGNSVLVNALSSATPVVNPAVNKLFILFLPQNLT